MTINKSNWSDSGTPANASWLRTSGIDASIPLYDDATISYDDITEYYDGYNANIITEDDVKFDSWVNSGTLLNSSWSIQDRIDYITDEIGSPITDEMGNYIESDDTTLPSSAWSADVAPNSGTWTDIT